MAKAGRGVSEVLEILSEQTRRGLYAEAPVYQGDDDRTDPFRTLVGCLISTRTRDEQTARVSRRVFEVAPSAQALAELGEERLSELLYGAGFYRQKAKQIRNLAATVVEKGEVPRTREELLKLPGIGPKCANIVLARCFGAPVIAVDTHVHRIANRLGWVRSKSPSATEEALTPIVPISWRRRVNLLLVAHGQLVCRPLSPRCMECSVSKWCERRGVTSAPMR